MTGFSGLFIIIYLAITLAKHHEKEFFALVASEGGFLKWAVALMIVYAVAKRAGPGGENLLWLVYAALLLQAVHNNPQVFTNLTGQAGISQTSTSTVPLPITQ